MLKLAQVAIALSAVGCLVSGSGEMVAEAIPACLSDGSATKAIGKMPGESQVYVAPIKRREGRTPIIEVTFNDHHRFEMILDTGANNTVITRQMAEAMQIRSVSRLKFDTASARGVELDIGAVRSLAVDGAIAKNLKVAIAGPELSTGLLGQDFFGDYDITIKRDVVEFQTR